MENRKRVDLVVAKLTELEQQGLDGSVTIHLRKGRAEKVEIKTVEALAAE